MSYRLIFYQCGTSLFGVASVTLESAGRLLAIALLGDAAKPKSKCLEG
jgi:hypothetical protein